MERKLRITVEGRQYIVMVEDITEDGSLLFPEPGSMYAPATVAVTAPSSTPHPAAGPGDELSPLAGVVHTVEVTVGQMVHEGDLLVSLEAMKMATKVVAHCSGKVAQIHVKPGDAVEAGQRLLTIA